MARSIYVISFFLVFNIIQHPKLQAQTSVDTLSYALDSLQVEAIRSAISPTDAPLSLTIKTRTLREITGNAALSLASITQGLPGIWVNNRQNEALGERITIRGLGWRAAFGVRAIQIVLDGIPLTVADGQSITNIIDPAFIRRVELIRGPAASYWGNSSGGVLYLSTEPDYSQPKDFFVRFYGGSYKYRKVGFQFHERLGSHRFSIYTSYQHDNGYRNYSASKLLRSGVQGSYQFQDDSRLEYVGALLVMLQAQHPSSLNAKQVDKNPQQANQAYVASRAGKQTAQGQLGFSYLRDTNVGFITLSAHGIYRDLSNPLPFGIITIDRLAGGMRAGLEREFSALSVNIGAEVKFQHDDRREFENDSGNRGAITINQLEKVSNQALFLTSSYTLGPFKLLGGLRYDRITFSTDSSANNRTNSRTFQALSPNFGVSLSIGTAGTAILYSNFSTSFQAPTTTELVNRPGGGNGFNPNLKPEQIIGLEAGSRGFIFDGLMEYDVALYKLWIHDLLFPYQLEINGPVFYRNQGETRHQGLEIATTITTFEDISLHTAYMWTNAEFIQAQTLNNVSLEGKAVPGVPEHRISAGLSWSPDPFWLQLNSQYVSSFPVNNLNSVSTDPHIVVDGKFSYKEVFAATGVTITPFININNIFNTRYNASVAVNASGGRYYVPAPGRNWQAGISFRF